VKFFYRYNCLSLAAGNKTSGFEFVISTEALNHLMGVPFSAAQYSRFQDVLQERVKAMGLRPARLFKDCHVLFFGETLCPRVFIQDAVMGGSLGLSYPDDLSHLDKPDYRERVGDSLRYTPHNVDLPQQALALMVITETWAEFAHLYLPI
jgi:hypothetical protein